MGLLSSAITSLLGSSEGTNTYSTDIIDSVYAAKYDTQALFKVVKFYNDDLPASNFFSSKAGSSSIELDIAIASFDVGMITTSVVEEWIGNSWVSSTGAHVMKMVTFTFRDVNNGKFYSNFVQAWSKLKHALPEKQYWTIDISSISERNHYANGTLSPVEYAIPPRRQVLSTSTAILDSISSLTFDKSQVSDILTFDVVFKYYITDGLN
jgi:hypothetical protein